MLDELLAVFYAVLGIFDSITMSDIIILVVLVIIGKADVGAVFQHHNFTIKPDFRIMK